MPSPYLLARVGGRGEAVWGGGSAGAGQRERVAEAAGHPELPHTHTHTPPIQRARAPLCRRRERVKVVRLHAPGGDTGAHPVEARLLLRVHAQHVAASPRALVLHVHLQRERGLVRGARWVEGTAARTKTAHSGPPRLAGPRVRPSPQPLPPHTRTSGRSVVPMRASMAALNSSTPRSSTSHISRAFWRSVRAPMSLREWRGGGVRGRGSGGGGMGRGGECGWPTPGRPPHGASVWASSGSPHARMSST